MAQITLDLEVNEDVLPGYRIASIKDVRDLTADSANRKVLEDAPVWRMRLHDGYLDTEFGYRVVRKFKEQLAYKVLIKLSGTTPPSASDAGSKSKLDAAAAEVALMYALEDENETEIADLLKENSSRIERILYDPPSVKLGSSNGGTPIHYCAQRGKLKALQGILKCDSNVRENVMKKLGTLLDNDGDNALIVAIHYQKQEVVEELVSIAGKKLITHCNHDGENAIMYALKKGNYAAFDTMWEKHKNTIRNADVDKAGKSLLHHWGSCRESNATDGTNCKRVGETLLQHWTASSAFFPVDAFGRTPLMVALRSKNRDACDLLLEKLKPGVDNRVAATYKDREGDTILHCYARSDLPDSFLRSEKLLGMFDEGDSWVKELINVRNDKGETPLMIAAQEDCKSSVRALWSITNLDLEVQDEEGNTSLHYLACINEQQNCQEGRRSFVKELLLQAGRSGEIWKNVLEKKNKQGLTVVAIAARVGSLELLSWLLQCASGLQLDCKVLCCCVAAGSAQKLQVFLKASKLSCDKCAPAENSEECSCNLVSKWMPDGKDASGLSLLHHAAVGGDPDLFLRVLGDEQSQIKHEDPLDGHTPLFWLLRYNININSDNENFLKRVLSNSSIRADALMHRDRRGRTLLHFASEEGVVLQLLSCGLQADARDDDGETVLHVASRSGNTNLVQFWLRRDIRVRCDTSSGTQEEVRLSDVRDYAGETPLHEAVRSKKLHAANLLLDDVKPDLLDDQQRDEDGRTVLHWAVTVAANMDQDQRQMVTKIQEQAFLITEMLLEYARQDSRHMQHADRPEESDQLGYMDLLLATSAGPSIGNALENVHPSFSTLKVLLEERTRTVDDLGLVRKALRYGYKSVAKELINRGLVDITLLKPEEQKEVTDEVLERSSDQPSHEDFLGRIEIAKGVAAFLLNPFTDTLITIGVFGHWGVGKSSVMLQVEKILLLTLSQKMLKTRKQIMQQLANLISKDRDTPEAVIMSKFFDEYSRKEWFPLYRGLAFGDVNKRESKKRSFNILSISTARNNKTMVGAVHLILSECEINVVFGVNKEMIQRAIDNQLKTLAGEKDQPTKKDESGSGKMDKEISADTFLAKIIQVPIDLSQPSTKSMEHFLSAQLGVQNKGKDGGVRNGDSDIVMPEMQQSSEDHLSIQFKSGRQVLTRNVASTDQFIVHSPVLLAQYNESEVRAFKYLLTMALGRNSQPRQWKRLLSYHRLVWNIISQREGVKRIAGWQRQLTVWVFVCWQWKDEMNYIIENWRSLVKPPSSAGHMSTRGLINKQAPQEPSQRDAGAENSANALENQKKEQPTENAENQRKEQPPEKRAPNSLRRVVKDAMNEVMTKACSALEMEQHQWKKTKEGTSWTQLEETLSSGGSEGYDVNMEALQIFQDFRFHCRVDYIDCSGC